MNDLHWNDKPLDNAVENQGALHPSISTPQPLSPSPQTPSSSSHSSPPVDSPMAAFSTQSIKRSSSRSPTRLPEYLKQLDKESRYWENVNSSNNNIKNGLRFSIMSYNILAQSLLETHKYLYCNCQHEYIQWNYRFERITKEINDLNPDIICLQEVQNTHLSEITEHLNKHGFKGIFKQKTGEKEDGCAIFFKDLMFEDVGCHSVEFMQRDVTLLNRHNIGLLIKLKVKSIPDCYFIVCTTHLLYNPRRDDVRLAQMQVFLAEIDKFSFQHSARGRHHLPIIMTGDLNSLPGSLVTSLVMDGVCNPDTFATNLHKIAVTDNCQHLAVFKERQEGPQDYIPSSALYHSEKEGSYCFAENTCKFVDYYKDLFCGKSIKHTLNFKSVYNHVKEHNQIEATTHQDWWVTVDYIYYSSGTFRNLDMVQRYRLPTIHECQKMGSIPNSQYGSDHISLAAKFIICSSP